MQRNTQKTSAAWVKRRPSPPPGDAIASSPTAAAAKISIMLRACRGGYGGHPLLVFPFDEDARAGGGSAAAPIARESGGHAARPRLRVQGRQRLPRRRRRPRRRWRRPHTDAAPSPPDLYYESSSRMPLLMAAVTGSKKPPVAPWWLGGGGGSGSGGRRLGRPSVKVIRGHGREGGGGNRRGRLNGGSGGGCSGL